MSEVKGKVKTGVRRFTEQFKRDAVRLVIEEKYSMAAAAKAVGASEPTLRQWHRRSLTKALLFLEFRGFPECRTRVS
jgi:transposase-like protein